MGYTHYWNQIKELPLEEWQMFAADVRLALDSPIIANGFGEEGTKPTIDDNEVWFNGKEGTGYETVRIVRISDDREPSGWPERSLDRPHFNFTKTARKAYDPIVVDVLILAEYWFYPLLEVKSDGDWEKVKRDRLNLHRLMQERSEE